MHWGSQQSMCLVFALIRSFLSLLAPNQPALAMLAVLLCHSEMMQDLTGSGPQVSPPRLQLSEWTQGTPARGPYNGH